MSNEKIKHPVLKHLKKSVSCMKIRTKLLLLILVAGISCLCLFRFLWLQKWDVWGFIAYDCPIHLDLFPRPADDFYDKLVEEAPKYNIPASEDDEESIKALQPFFKLADDYTAIYLYGLEDGLFRTGYVPQIMDNDSFRTFFDIGYEWTEGSGERISFFPLRFKNGYAQLHVSFYHSSCFIFPYFMFCLVFCIILFLAVVLFFVNKKIKTVISLKETILHMSSGDLDTPVTCMGQDEIGILAKELDHLRCTLRENFLAEQELHKSNQELIAALSHDLRTPLTILKGYLEILHLNRNAKMHAEYVQRCIQKTDDIQEMTDRMFEYALVFDEKYAGTERAIITEIPLEFLLDSLREHMDFLRLAGFQSEFHSSVLSDSKIWIMTDTAMLKRVLNNLFSNIIKYANKKEAVSISVSVGEGLVILLKNGVKSGFDEIESTKIGLKSVQKMMDLMDGALYLDATGSSFVAELRFALMKYG